MEFNDKFSGTIYLRKPNKKNKLEIDNTYNINLIQEENKDEYAYKFKDAESKDISLERRKIKENIEEHHEDVNVYEKGKEVKISDFTENELIEEININKVEDSENTENYLLDLKSNEELDIENIENIEKNEESINNNVGEDDEEFEDVELSTSKYIINNFFIHQKEAIKSLNQSNENDIYKAILVIPNNGGKTFTGVYWALNNIIGSKKKVLWISSRYDSLEKVKSSLFDLSGEENIPNINSFNYRIISKDYDKISNLQKDDDFVVLSSLILNKDEKHLKNWIENNKDSICLIIDEANYAISNVYKNIINILENNCKNYLKIIGITSSIRRNRENNAGVLSKIFTDGICHITTIGSLINREILSKPTMKEYYTDIEIYSDFDDIEEEISHNDERNNFIVNTYIDFSNKKESYKNTLIITYNENQAKLIKSLLLEKDIKCDILLPDDESEVKSQKVDNFENSEIDVLIDFCMEVEKFKLKKLENIFIAKLIASTIEMNQIISIGINGDILDGKNELFIISFIDNYKHNIDFINPSNIIDLYVGKEENHYYKSSLEKTLIPNKLMYEFRNINNISYKNLPEKYIDLIPIGSYIFNLFNESVYFNKICEVLVFENLKELYQNMIDNLENVFNSCEISLNTIILGEDLENSSEDLETEDKDIEEITENNIEQIDENKENELIEESQEDINKENELLEELEEDINNEDDLDSVEIFRLTLLEDELEKLYNYVLENIFKDYKIEYGFNKKDLFDIFNYFYLTNEKPDFYPFKDREKYDLEKLANEIIDYDLSSNKEYEYLNVEWNNELNAWKKYFSNNKDIFFKEVHRVKDYLYSSKSEVEENKEVKDYKKLSLVELYKEDRDYYENLKEKVFDKYKHKEGYYEVLNFKSMYKRDFEINYIKPLSEGGLTVIENLELSPRLENISDKDEAIDLDYLKIKIESVYSNKRYNTSLKYLNEYLKVKKDIWALNLIGNCYLYQKKYKEALRYYYEIIEIDEFNEEANFKIAYIYSKIKKHDMSLNYYDKVIDINYKNINAFHNKGIILNDMECFDEALECFDKFLEIELDDEVLNLKGNILCDMERYEEGAKCYEKAIEVCKDNKYLVKIFNKFGKKNKPRL